MSLDGSLIGLQEKQRVREGYWEDLSTKNGKLIDNPEFVHVLASLGHGY